MISFTILVVEDHKEIRENITEILELAGHAVIGAENGEVGFELAKHRLPDIIICDIRMPVMNGHELLKKLKNHNTTSKIPFVFATSNSEKMNIHESVALGAAGYLVKPFEVQELLTMIKQILT